MEVLENCENKEFDIHLTDFPFICRICLRRGDLRLFEQEDFLLDLFVAITKIDVCSTVNFPINICNECIKELKDISLFIDIAKYNYSRSGKNVIPKKENEVVEIVEVGTSQEPVVKTEKITGEYEEDICTEICQICLVQSYPTPFEDNAPLMQLFQNITNIDLEDASNFSSRNRICNKCIDKLKSISLFISSSLSNDMKIASTIGGNVSLKSENCLGKSAIDFRASKGSVMKFDYFADRKEVKVENYLNENVCSYGSKDLHTVIDIKEEILDSPEAPVRENDQKGLELCSGTSKAHIGMKQSKCEFCEKTFTLVHHLKQHMLIHKAKKPFECDSCGKSYNKKQQLKLHMLTHTGEKPFKCHNCHKSFYQKLHLQCHMSIHTGYKPFECDYCKKKFAHEYGLKLHLLSHTGKKTFKCDSCGKSFKQKQHMKSHMLSHTGEKPFECSRCEKSYRRRGDLKEHMVTHTGKKPFKCDICEKRFTHRQNLRKHSLIHTGIKPFKCDVCHIGVGRKDDLKKHKLTHTGAKPFKCVICQIGVTRKAHLKKHMLTHTGEKLFKCDSCGKGFNQKWNLKTHMRTHTGEKPYKCASCERSFSKKQSLRLHVDTHR